MDAIRLLRDVRDVDRREWEDATGVPLERQLPFAVQHPSAWCFSIHENRPGAAPLLIWGADRLSNKLAQVWLIATNEAARRATSLHGTMALSLHLLDNAYPHSVAYADARNVVHLRWLERLGWKAVGTTTAGPESLPFIQYERAANVWSSPRHRLHGGGGGLLSRAT